MGLTNFPNGVSSFGVPVLGTGGDVGTGNVYFVDSGVGNDSGSGTFDKPFATLDYAIGRCTASNGDRIFLKEGHAETVSAAGGIAVDVIGVSIIGIGKGALRPTFTFSATASTMTMSAASCSIENVIIKPSIDSVVSPIVVSAANVTIGRPGTEVQFEDASDTVEMVRAILTTAAADNMTVNARYLGRTGGNACVNAIRLVGCNGGRINLDFYGLASTSIVEFHTTACTDIIVLGRFYNSGTTNGTKNVVDTQGAGTWFAVIEDSTAGATYSGGSGGALAADDVAAVSSALATLQAEISGAAGIASFPAGAAPANAVSLAEAVRDIWDAVRNGTGGTEPGTNKSVIDAIGMTGTARIADAAGQLAAANGTLLPIVVTVVSSSIPNNTQTGGAITGAASGNLILEEILINTDATGVVNPTNLEFSTDNVSGNTGAGDPIALEAVAALGANVSESKKDFTSHSLPMLLESGKKVFIHGDDAAGTGAGVATITLMFRRAADGATIAGVNLP